MSDEGFPRVLLEVFLRLKKLTPQILETEQLLACFVKLRLRCLTALQNPELARIVTRSTFQ